MERGKFICYAYPTSELAAQGLSRGFSRTHLDDYGLFQVGDWVIVPENPREAKMMHYALKFYRSHSFPAADWAQIAIQGIDSSDIDGCPPRLTPEGSPLRYSFPGSSRAESAKILFGSSDCANADRFGLFSFDSLQVIPRSQHEFFTFGFLTNIYMQRKLSSNLQQFKP